MLLLPAIQLAKDPKGEWIWLMSNDFTIHTMYVCCCFLVFVCVSCKNQTRHQVKMQTTISSTNTFFENLCKKKKMSFKKSWYKIFFEFRAIPSEGPILMRIRKDLVIHKKCWVDFYIHRHLGLSSEYTLHRQTKNLISLRYEL